MADNTDNTEKRSPAPTKKAAPQATKSTEPQLPAPAGYALQDWPGGARIVTSSYGVVDLNTLTPNRAAQLVARGFKFLRKK